MNHRKRLADLPSDERDRAIFLHRICARIAMRQAEGVPLVGAIRKEANRARRGEFKLRGGRKLVFSRKSLTRHFYAWKKDPSPDLFIYKYKSAKEPVPPFLIREFLRRCLRVKTPGAARAYRSLVEDWNTSKPVPGLGTWRTYVRKKSPCQDGPSAQPKFPFSRATFARRFSKADAKRLHLLRAAQNGAGRALNDFQREILARSDAP